MEYFEMLSLNGPKAVVRNIKDIAGFEGNYIKIADDLVITSRDKELSVETALKTDAERNTVNLIIIEEECPNEISIDLIEKLSDIPMITVTTKSAEEGAAALFYPGILDKICRIFCNKFICIPSSREEWVLLKKEFNPGEDVLNAMIQDMNQSRYVGSDNVLSDHAYLYDGETKSFKTLGESE